jgi:hypothetical protein
LGTSKLAVHARQVTRLPCVPSFSVPQLGQKTFMVFLEVGRR